ncbi:hypothetical protein M2262_003178 [Pseudomonas sp. BIGb0408]|uniref:Uncharacterized protein n=1 Tax=Phytopseudomonas flavescens TaxID=29435 RepID=A0A7Y9XLQ3_9GAMM|nr:MULTISPECIES: hypothetical protein [Pseudomonas]MCW2293128.1 hypothetical protein [Pseudomonas sp. BIGb0408]NYH72302.1 hypothetical protein [Pseudomonas flavescens]
MSNYELIKDLEKKLSIYRQAYPEKPSSQPNRIHEKIASLVLKAKLYPARLTREVVKSLIQDREPWPTIEGYPYCLAHPINIETLESARLISFPNDNLCVQRTTEISGNMPTQLRNELSAHRFLYEIRYHGGELSSPHLRLHKSEIGGPDLALVGDRLTPDGDYLRIAIEDDDIFGVGTYLWNALRITKDTPDEAFDEYTIRMRTAADRPYVFEIDFENRVDLDEFLGCALAFIKSDQKLLEDWSKCAADIALDCNRIESLTELSRTPGSTDISYANSLNLQPLQDVIDGMQKVPRTTLLEAIEWFKRNDRHGYYDRDHITGFLVWLIIKNEHNAYTVQNSFKLTQRLIEHSQIAPKLNDFLFRDITDPSYLCFLLSFNPTSHIGLIALYQKMASNALRRASSKVDYEKAWQDLIWTQGLEVYCNSFESNIEYKHVRGTLESICEMVAWFVSHEFSNSSNMRPITDTRIPSLKATILSLKYITEMGYKQNLFEDHLVLIGELIHDRAFENRSLYAPAPMGHWLVLFWSIEISEKKNISGDNTSRILAKTLTSSYLQVLNDRRHGKSISGDDPTLFDDLSWGQLLPHLSKLQQAKWLLALHEWPDRIEGLPAGESSALNSAVRLHLRTLLNVHDSSLNGEIKGTVFDELCSIIDRFGFAPDDFSGALNYTNDHASHSPLRLWRAICELTNDVSSDCYNSFLNTIISRKPPLSALFDLLDRTNLQERKATISAIIASRNVELEKQYWVPEIFDTAIKAANNNHITTAKYLLENIQKNSHKTHRAKVEELIAKVSLKEIFDDASKTPVEKIEILSKFEATIQEQEISRSIDEFRIFLIATLEMPANKEASIAKFARLTKASPTLQNATGLINSLLSIPEMEESVALLNAHYTTWMGVFENYTLANQMPELADESLHSVLQACLRMSLLSEFSGFWGSALKRQRDSYQFADVRTEYLTKLGRHTEALSYVKTLLDKLDDQSVSARNELINIQTGLLEPLAQPHSSLAQVPAVSVGALEAELRNSWLRIKNLGALSQSQIFIEPTNSIDNYLLEIMEQVGNELLMRVGNLLRKKVPAKSSATIPLDDEDLINDWMVSLLRQKMSFIGWTVHDQSRMGRSASGKGVGETDGWIQDGKGNPISIIEAFRLGNSVDRNVIREHLDKIAGYNSSGICTLFIVIYSSSNDFSELCSNYASYINSQEYKGFDSRGSSPSTPLVSRKVNPPKAEARYYEEARYVNGERIKIYHQILNLRVPD